MESLNRQRHYNIIKAIAAGLGVLGVVVLLVAGWFNLYIYQPSKNYFAMEQHSQWRPLNARLMAFHDAGDFAQAERKLYKVIQKGPYNTSPTPYFLLASLFDYTGQSQKALKTYDAALQVAQKDWYSGVVNSYYVDDIHAAKAIIYYEQGKLDLAQAELSSIVHLESQKELETLSAMANVLDDPQRADYHFELGKAFRHLLKLPQAKKELETALALSHDPLTQLRIKNYLKTRMPAQTTALNPLVRYYTLAGSAQQDQENGGNPQLAESFYRQAISEAPDFEWPYQQLALLHKEQREFDEASYYAERTLAINPAFYLSYMTLGDIALDQEKYSDAVTYFSQAQTLLTELGGKDEETLLVNVENQIGFAQELLQNTEQALQHYQNALAMADNTEVDPSDTDYAQAGVARIKEWMVANQDNTKKAILAKK